MPDLGMFGDAELHSQIDHNLTNHAPRDAEIIQRFEVLRELAKEFLHAVVDLCPVSRERSLAITNGEQAVQWAVAAIARNQDKIEAPEVEEAVTPWEDAEGLERAAEEALERGADVPVQNVEVNGG